MSGSSWNFKDNLTVDNNKFLTFLNPTGSGKNNIMGLDTSSNLHINSAKNGDIYFNSNNTGSNTFFHINNSKNTFINSKLAVGIMSTANINSNITLPINSFIGLNTTQGSHTGYLSIAASSSLLNTSGSRITLYGINNTLNAGQIKLYTGNNTAGHFQVYTKNDSMKMQILSDGTSNFQPDGSTIRLSIGDVSTIITNPVNITSTKESNNICTGALVVSGGGASFAKDVYIGQKLNVNNINIEGNLYKNGYLYEIPTTDTTGGVYTEIVGTFQAENNISIPTPITNLIFPNVNIRSFTLNISIQLLAGNGSNNLYAYYTINGIQNSSGWAIDDSYIGDNTDVYFSIDNNGQIYYTSSDILDWISCKFNYKATSYSISGNYIQPPLPMSGNFEVTQNLSVLGTTDSESVSYGSIIAAGGVGISKTLHIGSGIYSPNIHLIDISGGYIDFKTSVTGDFNTRIKNDSYNNALNFYTNIDENNGMTLSADGTLSMSGDIGAFASISDRTLKTNIINISPDTALDTINMLRPVTFNWKDDIFNIKRRGELDSGFIAQEVEEVIPHAVGQYTTVDNLNTYKNMRHERIIPYLVGSIQKLEEKIKQLEIKLQHL